MRAVLTEIRRFFRRRATWVVALLALVIAGLLTAALWYGFRPPSAETQAEIARDYEQALSYWEWHSQEIVQRCLDETAAQRATDPSFTQDCSSAALMPNKEDFGWTSPALTEVWRLVQTSTIPAVACFLALIAVSTFIGAEFSSGNIATWLTFETRRTRVYLSKLIACVIGSVFIFVVCDAATMGGAMLAVYLDEGSLTIPAGYWLDTALPWAGRGAVVVAAAGCAAGALTFLVRRTIGVLGLAMGYLVVGEVFLSGLIAGSGKYTLFNNICAFVAGEWTYTDYVCSTDPSVGYACESVDRALTFTWASTELGAIVGLCLFVGWLVFRRRDVAS